MQYEQFIHRVQEYADLATRDEAVRLTEIVLATLGERLYRTEQHGLAAQLPRELKGALVARQPSEQARTDVQYFSLEEFYNRVKSRMNIGYREALRQTKAVIAVLQEAISVGAVANILAELPAEYGELLQRGD
jgi:uncharacterized protein (DUF2267 family)